MHIRDIEREKEKEKGFTPKTNERSEFDDVYEIRLDDVLWAGGREVRDGTHTAGT